MAKHKTQQQPNKRVFVTLLTATVIVLTAILYIWLAPANLIPIPQQEQTCTVTYTSTHRIHTIDCGTFYTRTNLNIKKWKRYTVHSTGKLAWEFSEES